MFENLTDDIHEIMEWSWEEIEPFFREMEVRALTEESVEGWLEDWSRLAERIAEWYSRLYVATTQNTSDQQVERQYHQFLEQIFPNAQAAEQKLKEKLLASGLEPAGFEVPLRNMGAQAEIFREENLPLLTEEQKLVTQYDKIVGAQTVEWEGEEITVEQINRLLVDPDREVRRRAWRLGMDRWLEDREAINRLWGRFLEVREQLAVNAGLTDYRTYRWRQMLRFDYTPEDCLSFQRAIEEVVVPAARRVYERRRRRAGLDTLRPWDVEADPLGRAPLAPYHAVEELEAGAARIFSQIDPRLGDYFATMREEKLLDLENRPDKAPGGYCIDFALEGKPFIFMNAVGIHDNVQTLLHEAGHAFHVFESDSLRYYQQKNYPSEFAEVASMSMELLAGPHLEAGRGGYYSPEDMARARIEHLEGLLLFWPYMAVVDAFQHWVYENPAEARRPEACDERWGELWDRFRLGEDWSGLELEKNTGWHRKLHIHQIPFYYVEYGLAQLGAVQVWRNALDDQETALTEYRKALALGGTRPLPDLYRAAGARLAFDGDTLGEAVALIEATVTELDELQVGN